MQLVFLLDYIFFANCPDATSISPRLYFFREIRNKRHNFENSYFFAIKDKTITLYPPQDRLLKKKAHFPQFLAFFNSKNSWIIPFWPHLRMAYIFNYYIHIYLVKSNTYNKEKTTTYFTFT